VLFRSTSDDFDSSAFTSIAPAKRTNQLISAFIQDEIEIIDTLHLSLGTKIEHNDYTGIELQPSARVAWTPSEKHTLWAAISRAVSTPNRAENDIRLNFGELEGFPGIFGSVFGNRGLKSEELMSYEIGFRAAPTERMALDLVVFYNDYDHAHSIDVLAPIVEPAPPPPHTLAPIIITSDAEVKTYGFEASADFSIKPWWLVRSSYSYIRVIDNNEFPSTGAELTPRNILSLQNRFDLPHNLEFDTILRYVDTVSAGGVPGYLEMDARLSWRPREDLEISLIGRNLLDSERPEYDDTITLAVPTQVQRGIAGKIAWRF
jgi:iron complex outermembrane receptor protein